MFLGREAGLVENTLYIHTSAGSFRYTVEGTGTPNPYRIQVLITSLWMIPKTLQQIKINQFDESFSSFFFSRWSVWSCRWTQATLRSSRSTTLTSRPSRYEAQSTTILDQTSNLFRCWRCTQAEEICTWSYLREVWRRTTACGRSHHTTPSLLCAQPSSPGLRATTQPISGIGLILAGRVESVCRTVVGRWICR